MFKSSALKLNDSMLHSVAGAPPRWFPGNAASKAKFAKPISSTANVWVPCSRWHARLNSRATSAAAKPAPRGRFRLPAHAVRSFPEHRRRDPKGPASAHVAPVCHMHYDAACPQWNGSIAVASRCTSKTTRLRTFTSSRQVTNVYLWLSNRSKYWRARPIHAM